MSSLISEDIFKENLLLIEEHIQKDRHYCLVSFVKLENGQLKHFGTGFLCGFCKENKKYIFLITATHVLEDVKPDEVKMCSIPIGKAGDKQYYLYISIDKFKFNNHEGADISVALGFTYKVQQRKLTV